MNLYLIKRNDSVGDDEFDSAIVAAESEDDAREIHPGKDTLESWQDSTSTWIQYAQRDSLTVRLLAKTTSEPRGVVLGSFNAG